MDSFKDARDIKGSESEGGGGEGGSARSTCNARASS